MGDRTIDKPATSCIRDRTVLVTGGFGGIGTALVAACLEAGAATVVAAGRHPGPAEGRCVPLALDVADERSVEAVAERWAGEVDIVVNNAGINRSLDLLGRGAGQAFFEEWSVNALGLMNMVRSFAPPMAAREGSAMVNVLSVLSRRAVPMLASYCASKAAALSITESARQSFPSLRIVNLFPTVVDTPMSAKIAGKKLRPEDVAAAVLHGLSTGQADVHFD